MKTSFLVLLAGISFAVGFTGCVSTVDGRTRGGVPFSKDRLESRYERPLEVVVSAARETLKFNGTLSSEDVINHVLTAKIDTRTVWVKVDEVEPKITRVVTQARGKGGGADIYLAAEIDKQIALRLPR
jgi:hypothetical protein